MPGRPLVVVAAIAALAILPSSGLARGSKPPTVISANCHGHNFKPSRIILACGDAGLYVDHLSWKQWSRKEAKGIGTGTGKTCEPNCAAGGTKSGSMEIRLFKPSLCHQDQRVHFTRMRYRWTNGSPVAGQPNQGVIPSPCSAV
jgi:hypothetical protein